MMALSRYSAAFTKVEMEKRWHRLYNAKERNSQRDGIGEKLLLRLRKSLATSTDKIVLTSP